MKWVGAHVSASGGVHNAPINAFEIGATAFALFVKNQKQWFASPLKNEDIDAFKTNCKEGGYTPLQILPHAGYLINPANPDPEARKKSLESLVQEMDRCRLLGLDRLNLHPGSHLGKATLEQAMEFVAELLDQAIEKVDGVRPVIENTAGQGNGIGHDFETIHGIIERMKHSDMVGFCLDTCHAYSAGYDLVSEDGYKKTMKEIEKTLGFKRLLGVHINDSKTPFNSRKDRHESLGKGSMGWKPFQHIMNDKRFNKVPLILETVDVSIWPEEIEALKGFEKKKGKS